MPAKAKALREEARAPSSITAIEKLLEIANQWDDLAAEDAQTARCKPVA
jgi:hypothetical protein